MRQYLYAIHPIKTTEKTQPIWSPWGHFQLVKLVGCQIEKR